MTWGGTAAWAQNSEEEMPADTKFLRKLLKEFGMRLGDEEAVEFRERAPLVVPPSRSLPPPQNSDLINRNPAWPKDPDVRRRNEAAVPAGQRARLRGAAEAIEEDGRALRPNELNVGRVTTQNNTPVQHPDESARPLPPSALGSRGFWNMFSTKAEPPVEFNQERQRSSLTEPPPGYQTPSAAHPYGPGQAKQERAKQPSAEDRVVGY